MTSLEWQWLQRVKRIFLSEPPLPAIILFIIANTIIWGWHSSYFRTCTNNQAYAYDYEQHYYLISDIFSGLGICGECWFRYGFALLRGNIWEIVTAIATVVIANFTRTLWKTTKDTIKHGHEVERAYVVGGGPTATQIIQHGIEISGAGLGGVPTKIAININPVYLDIENRGKTPAFIKEIYWGNCPEKEFTPYKDIKISEIMANSRSDKNLRDRLNIKHTMPIRLTPNNARD